MSFDSPKKSDYKPTEAEKANAAVALQRHRRFKQNFGPLLKTMGDKALTDDKLATLRNRANADVQQALTNDMSLSNAMRTDAASDSAQAMQGQLAQATTQAKNIQNKMATNVLGIAQGQEADAATGLAKASRLSTSEALTRAKSKVDENIAKSAALAQVAGAAAGKISSNKNSADFAVDAKGDVIKDPVTNQPVLIRGTAFKPAYKREGSLGFYRGY